MNSLGTQAKGFESTYALIVRSEEKQRSLLETVIYSLLVVSTVFAVSQFGREAMTLPNDVGHASITIDVPPPLHGPRLIGTNAWEVKA